MVILGRNMHGHGFRVSASVQLWPKMSSTDQSQQAREISDGIAKFIRKNSASTSKPINQMTKHTNVEIEQAVPSPKKHHRDEDYHDHQQQQLRNPSTDDAAVVAIGRSIDRHGSCNVAVGMPRSVS